MKKSFTLIELIIVIILISSTYFLIFPNSNFSQKNKQTKLSLENIKEYLLTNFEYTNKLEFICIENEFKCYVRVDGKIQDNLEIENLFEEKPEVYEYTKELDLIDYKTININDINENIIFLFSLNSDYKSNEFILDTLNKKIYLFNAIFKEAQTFTSLSEVRETFNLKQIEVQDAF